jgi:hypothetical protein
VPFNSGESYPRSRSCCGGGRDEKVLKRKI